MTNQELQEKLASLILLLRVQGEEPDNSEVGAAVVRDIREITEALTDYIEDANYLSVEKA